MNTFWVSVQGHFKSWKLGMLMKYTQILGHHYTQPIEWFYQATKHIAHEWELDKKIRHEEVKCRVKLYSHKLIFNF